MGWWNDTIWLKHSTMRLPRAITEKEEKNERLAGFIKILKAQDGIITEFDERLWSSMVDFVTVGRNKKWR